MIAYAIATTPSFQIIRRFGIYRYIAFILYLHMVHDCLLFKCNFDFRHKIFSVIWYIQSLSVQTSAFTQPACWEIGIPTERVTVRGASSLQLDIGGRRLCFAAEALD